MAAQGDADEDDVAMLKQSAGLMMLKQSTGKASGTKRHTVEHG
jgi:hypothetical protein